MVDPRPRAECHAADRGATAAATRPHKGPSNLLVYALLAAAVVAVFYQVLWHEFIDFDDLPYIVDNPHVTSGLTSANVAWAFTRSYEGYWAPITWLSYMLEAELFGLSSAATHAGNVVLHLLSSCLLFAILNRATLRQMPSAMVAALFAVHPLHVESVAWAAERKDVLAAFWYLLAVRAYLHYLERKTARRYLYVAGAFALGLMSKPMAVTLPVALLLLDVWPLCRLRSMGSGRSDIASSSAAATIEQARRWWPLLREKVPLFAMSLAASVVTVVVQSKAGAVAALDVAPVSTRLGNALVSLAVYLRQMAWPAGLAGIYPYPRSLPSLEVAAAGVLVVLVTAVTIRARRAAPYALIGWLWYLVTLLPVLGLIQAGPQARADRYTYLSMVGIAVAATWAVHEALERYARLRAAAFLAACLALTAYGAVAWKQAGYWQTTESVFRRALDVTAGNYVAHKGLGTALLASGHYREAIDHLRAAVELAPSYPEARSDLGLALLSSNEPAEAVVHLSHAVALRPGDSGFRVNLGSGLAALGRNEEAEAQYREALRIAPGNAEAHAGIGLALAARGDNESALASFRTAIGLEPTHAGAYSNMASLLAGMGRQQDAENAYREAVRLDPDNPSGWVGISTLLANQGRFDEAIAALSSAARLSPDDPYIQSNLGTVLASSGRVEEAISHFAEAVRLRPDFAEARANLDLALSMRGQTAPDADPGRQPSRQKRPPAPE